MLNDTPINAGNVKTMLDVKYQINKLSGLKFKFWMALQLHHRNSNGSTTYPRKEKRASSRQQTKSASPQEE